MYDCCLTNLVSLSWTFLLFEAYYLVSILGPLFLENCHPIICQEAAPALARLMILPIHVPVHENWYGGDVKARNA